MFRVARPSRDPVIIAVQVAGTFHGGTEYSFHDCLCFLDLRDSCCLLLVTKISLQSAKFRPTAGTEGVSVGVSISSGLLGKDIGAILKAKELRRTSWPECTGTARKH